MTVAAPHATDFEAPDPYVEETQWMMSTLRALTEIGMHMTRELCVDVAIEHRLEDETLRDVFGDKLSNEALTAAADTPKRRDPCADFGKLSRAVRLTLEQYGRASEAMRAYRLGLPALQAERAERRAKAQRDSDVAAQAAETSRREARVKTLRDIVFEAAEYEIQDRESLGDIERALDERLEADTAYIGLPDLPFEETVRRLCDDLHLSPDWSRWTGAGWTPPPPFFRPAHSWFATPSRKPSPHYAARRVVDVEARSRRLE